MPEKLFNLFLNRFNSLNLIQKQEELFLNTDLPTSEN